MKTSQKSLTPGCCSVCDRRPGCARQYGPTLAALYSRRDLVGYASRQLLHAPATYYHTVRQPGGLSTRQPLHRPAGVRLRAAADGRCVALVALLLLALVLAAGERGAAGMAV